jgi:ABC-type uncharacterized transport system involved in gliding motility auxiliary subunit
MAVKKDKEVRSAEGALKDLSTAETIGLILGVVGLTAIIFGVVLYAIDPDIWPLAAGNIALGVIGLLAYVATNFKRMGRTVAGRSTPFVVLEAMIVIGVLAAGALGNYFAGQSKKEWDLTRDGLFTLHERSIAVVTGMEKKVTVIGFFRPGDQMRETVRLAVELYKRHTDKIEVEFINPDSPDPERVKKYEMDSRSPPIVVVADTGQYTKIRAPSEEELTNALIKVAEKGQRKAYFLTGHQEPMLDDPSEEGFARAAGNLRNEGIVVEPLSLVDRENVPDDASVLVIAGAKRPLFPNESEAVRVWLDKGGRAVVLLDPGVDAGLEQLWRRYGILIGEDLVVDPASNAAGGFGPTAPIVQKFEPHPTNEKLAGGAMLFFNTRSVQPKVGLANLTVTTLVQTGPTSWGETAFQPGAEQVRDEHDVPGPVPIAVASTKVTAANPQKIANEARMVVVGDSEFINNRYSQMTANELFFTYAVNWTMGDEHKITIPPPKRGATRLTISDVEYYGVVFFSVNLLPLLIVGFGFSVWAVRRRK